MSGPLSDSGYVLQMPRNLPGDGVLGLVYGYSRPERYERVIMAFQAAIDDSGQGHGSVYVLAGFVAPAEAWFQFEDEWSEALKDNGLAYFKTREAMGFAGQFESGWDVPRRDAFILRLIDIIKRRVSFAVQVTLLHADYLAHVKGKIDRAMDQPYVLTAFSTMMVANRRTLYRDGDGPVDFVFDTENARTQGYVRRAHRASLRVAPLFGDPPIFRDDKRFLPLQAADLMAWHARHARIQTQEDPNHVYDAPAWLELSAIESETWHRHASDLQEMVRGVKEHTERAGQVFSYRKPRKPKG